MIRSIECIHVLYYFLSFRFSTLTIKILPYLILIHMFLSVYYYYSVESRPKATLILSLPFSQHAVRRSNGPLSFSQRNDNGRASGENDVIERFQQHRAAK